ncbi:hypothetical protein J8M20_20995 [Pseudoalteromonas luteoviolacea]|uniref:hypothetical protein n=1 Tax=Pseudoalteromonas luteoviolacea TaxID=43657 RepID=UPI001B368DDF|nr:hypothetical protein [Pseudoalteromonas luteoviolacea]MBQ4813855.1 hypothetical protein [Pseudoalteromonas luteoviolacea]
MSYGVLCGGVCVDMDEFSCGWLGYHLRAEKMGTTMNDGVDIDTHRDKKDAR